MNTDRQETIITGAAVVGSTQQAVTAAPRLHRYHTCIPENSNFTGIGQALLYGVTFLGGFQSASHVAVTRGIPYMATEHESRHRGFPLPRCQRCAAAMPPEFSKQPAPQRGAVPAATNRGLEAEHQIGAGKSVQPTKATALLPSRLLHPRLFWSKTLAAHDECVRRSARFNCYVLLSIWLLSDVRLAPQPRVLT